jgi:hypothetical protein
MIPLGILTRGMLTPVLSGMIVKGQGFEIQWGIAPPQPQPGPVPGGGVSQLWIRVIKNGETFEWRRPLRNRKVSVKLGGLETHRGKSRLTVTIKDPITGKRQKIRVSLDSDSFRKLK